ncbi:MAG: carbohydrate ABC transporter permease [Oscillospiraceae bacterium]|nr:carbohydrate ABC transporter permease [Oscillospiraceae bacterium]
MEHRLTGKTVLKEVILIVCTLIMLLPIFYLALGAFKGRTDIVKHPLLLTAEMFTWKNFPYAIKKMSYWKALGNTAFITGVSLAIVVICSSLAGFAIARLRGRIFSTYYNLLVALMVIPFIGCLLPTVILSVNLHTYNTLWGCVLIQSAWNIPFSTFLYTGFMRDLPKELEEAAYIDGCTTFAVYGKIFLPLLAPVTATCCIYAGVGIWNDYLVSSSLLNSALTPTLMVGIKSFFGQYTTEYGYAFAGIILASIPMVILFLSLQKYFIKGIAAGAVKG